MPATIKPKLGQNFLHDQGVRRRIVDTLGGAVSGTVVEIGPGKAAMTDLLATRAGRLIAIELDPLLAAALRTRFATMPSVEVIEQDVLTVDFSQLAAGDGRTLAVIGNLPYYITSPILSRLFAHERVIARAVVMVQLEVAERMAAAPGSRDYGLLSVLCRMHAHTELLFEIPPEAFNPAPKVHSAVVRLDFAPRWSDLEVEPGSFRRFVAACFAQKRKTLANNLKAAGYEAARIVAALASCGQSPSVRAEQLSCEAFAALQRAFDRQKIL